MVGGGEKMKKVRKQPVAESSEFDELMRALG